jgi:hypothetical protein
MNDSRRRFLQGSLGALAIPLLHSALPRKAWATELQRPQRVLFYYVPNGMPMPWWTPSQLGPGYDLPEVLQPLAGLQSSVSVLSGLDMPAATDPLPGDHARGTASFLTATRIRKTAGADISNGISIDQILAAELGSETPFPSLQVGLIPGGNTGDCTAGYSCAYSRNISWAGTATPMPNITDPQVLFDRLFGNSSSLPPDIAERRTALRHSVLDSVVGDANTLHAQLGQSDRAKLDEYLTSVRELELRVGTPGGTCGNMERPTNPGFADRIDLMTELMVLAMQCDLTRVMTFMMGPAASNQSFDFIGIPGAHHQISHHQNDDKNLESLRQIGAWEISQFADLLSRMTAVGEDDGTLLDNALVYFGSEISDGDAHSHVDIPVLLAGHGGGAYVPGTHTTHGGRPMADLFLSMAGLMGVNLTSFGDDGSQPLDL